VNIIAPLKEIDFTEYKSNNRVLMLAYG